MAKNLRGKTVDRDHAYQVWQTMDGSWTWYVLKEYSADENKPYGRWFTLVTSPFVGERGELGDTYISDVKANARRIKGTSQAEDALATLNAGLGDHDARAL
jgi:hypothetical protein